MLCQVHTHPQLSYVVIVGVGVIYYCPCLHWFSPAAAEHFSVHSSRHISVRSFHTFQRVMFGTQPFAPRIILVYSTLCFSVLLSALRSVLGARTEFRRRPYLIVRPLVHRLSSLLRFMPQAYAPRQWLLGIEGSCPAQLLTYHAGLAHSKLCYLTHKPADYLDL